VVHTTPLSAADIGCFRRSINHVRLQPVPFIEHRAITGSAYPWARDASVASLLLIGAVPGTKQQPPLMALLGVRALLVVNAELFCKRRVYSLPHESNGGVDERSLLTHITHNISSSHLQLESLSCCVMVLQRMQSDWALIMRRPASQLYVGIAAFDVATRVHAVLVVNAVTHSLKSTARSRASRIWTSEIGFDPAADSIRIWLSRLDSIQIQYSNRFEPYLFILWMHH